MGKIVSLMLFILISNLASTYAQTCNNFTFSSNASYTTCVSLPFLNSHLHWSYHFSNATVDLAFLHTGSDTSQWVAWALNVDRAGMIGAQALVAVPNSNGSIQAYTSAINDYGTGLQPSKLSFAVPRITAERVNGDVVIYATLVLPRGGTIFNQVWQVGPINNYGSPIIHALGPDNRRSVSVVDFRAGEAVANGSVDGPRLRRRKNIHGVLNAISWGGLMRMGGMAMKCSKVFNANNKSWYYLHVTIQTSAYIIGVAGWITGLKLGSESTGVTHHAHRNIGIVLFTFATLQVFAMRLKPEDNHKHRFLWKIYHISLGYTVIILSIINVYVGFDILNPEMKWRNIYTGVFLILLSAIWELLTTFSVVSS